MNVTFRTITGTSYDIDVDPTNAIGKTDFSSVIPNIPKINLQFYFKGNALEPTTTFSSLNYQSGDFIVVYTPQKYIKRPQQPPNSIIEFSSNRDITRIFATPDHPSVQPLPDISRKIENDDIILGPPVFASISTKSIPNNIDNDLISESLYDNATLSYLMNKLHTQQQQQQQQQQQKRKMQFQLEQEQEQEQEKEHNKPNAGNESSDNENSNPEPKNNSPTFADMNSLSVEDRESLKRLQNLTNLDMETIVQVYVACGKDENTTANCLLSMPN